MNIGDEIDYFIERFRNNPRKRAEFVEELIAAGRFTINMPRSGLARRIAERLRDGSFSDYYEFEKLLASALHPVLSNLNLNAVSDILINRLFSERYLLYARDVNVVLAAGESLNSDSLKSVIVRMAAAEGHYMAIKFYDLVLRGIDPDLAKLLKTAETSLIQMKKGLGEDIEMNRSLVRRIMGGVHGSHGDDAARLLLTRMEWDDDLREYAPQLAEESGLAGYIDNSNDQDQAAEIDLESSVIATPDNDGRSGDGPIEKDNENRTMEGQVREDAITRYARMIKNDYLDAVDPDDEGKIRGIIKGIYVKNEKVYNGEKAAETVKQVLALWLADASIDDRVRQILEDLARELDVAEESASAGHDDGADLIDERLTEGSLNTAESDEDTVESDWDHGEDRIPQGAISPEEENALLEDIREEHGTDFSNSGATHAEEELGETGPIVDDTDVKIAEGTESDHAEMPQASSVAETGPQEENINDGVMEDLISDVSGDEKSSSGNENVPGEELDASLVGYTGEITVEETSPDRETDPGNSAGSDISIEKQDMPLRERNQDDGNIPGNVAISEDEMNALLGGISDDETPVESPEQEGPDAGSAEDSFLLDDVSHEMKKPDEPSPSVPGADDEFLIEVKATRASDENIEEQIEIENEEFVVKDELLFEDKSFQRRAAVSEMKKNAKIRITMRDIADTEKRKNLITLLDLLSGMDAAADVSNYIVGSGVPTMVKSGITSLLDYDNFEESLDFIKNTDAFDVQERIIILQKWLKPVAARNGWFDEPHGQRHEKINKMLEALAVSIVKTGRSETEESAKHDQEETGYSPSGSDNKGKDLKLPAMPQKEMMKTGDESIKLSHGIDEFRNLYEAGIDDASVAERLPEIQGFFDSLAAGEDVAVHFAVYHKPAFISFLSFIIDNPDLNEQLDTEAALQYCKKNKIL
jgi:hypothetical protein